MQKYSKPNFNTGSNTTCKMIGVEDTLPFILLMSLFIKNQDYEVKENQL